MVEIIERGLPPRVQAAMDFIHWTATIQGHGGCSDASNLTRQLRRAERACHDRAIEVLTSYLAGEMDYGDAAPRRVADDGEDERVEVER